MLMGVQMVSPCTQTCENVLVLAQVHERHTLCYILVLLYREVEG